jgi:hypothetical protein
MVLRAVVLLAAALLAPSEPCRLIEVGTFHGDEISDADAGAWLGLFPEGQGYVWRDAVVEVKAVQDEDSDEPNERTGREVWVRGGAKPVLLLRGRESFKSTQVDAFPEVELRTLAAGDHFRLRIGKREYELNVTNPTRPGDPNMAGCSVRLTSEGVTQVLHTASEEADDPGWELMWAGDLDGDGQLDLYVQLSDHYNVLERILFVSTEAPIGQLVGELATFRTEGD